MAMAAMVGWWRRHHPPGRPDTAMHLRSIPLLLLPLLAACGEPPRDLTIAEFEQALAEAGLLIESRQTYRHERIEAIDGLGLGVGGDIIEVYDFDLCTGVGREAIRRYHRGGVMGREALRRRNLLLISREEHPEWSRVESVFRSL